MTTISAAAARTPLASLTPNTAATDAAPTGNDHTISSKALLGIAVAASAGYLGYKLLHGRTHTYAPSEVIGSIDGVNLLSNPHLPYDTRKLKYGMPVGTLFGAVNDAGKGRVLLDHVDQGQLADCFADAVQGAMAHQRPEKIEAMMSEHAEGIVARFAENPAAVTKELPLYKGHPAYAASGPDKVLWPAYLEKALAATAPHGYESLDHGGYSWKVFQRVTGVEPTPVDVPSSIIGDIKTRLAAGEPVVIGSRKPTAGSGLANAMEAKNVHGWHAYVAQEVKIGEDAGKLQLFNIWGKDHPKPLTESEVQSMFNTMSSDVQRYEW